MAVTGTGEEHVQISEQDVEISDQHVEISVLPSTRDLGKSALLYREDSPAEGPGYSDLCQNTGPHSWPGLNFTVRSEWLAYHLV